MAGLFAAFGMHPVGFYDLRDAASPVPVVSTAFRPVEADQLARNPFRVFTSMLATDDPRYFDAELRGRVERSSTSGCCSPPRSSPRRAARRDGRRGRRRAERFVASAVGRVRAVPRADRPRLVRRADAVSAVAADIAGVTTTHLNHLTPRVLDIDELYQRG